MSRLNLSAESLPVVLGNDMYAPFVSLPEAFTYKFSSPIYLKSKTLVEVKRTSGAFCVKASCYVDTSHNGRVRSLWSMLVHRC
jgi:hypothetical protein